MDTGESASGSEHPTVTVSDGSVEVHDLASSRARVPERYVLIQPLGSGGMGEVLRAYDPKLRREVALKRLLDDQYDGESQTRLVREAQAMARLSHPNVVAVHDVEVDGPLVTVVMEYVPGKTLRQWLAGLHEQPRPWSLILGVFRAAGRGLAAAHAVGLVHRDFKPANVLVTLEDGRPSQVKVTDFGLVKEIEPGEDSVRTSGPPPASMPANMPTNMINTLGGATLTATGSIMGTPRYMAPEQYFGGDVDAKADQFALCVALWEALTGVFPFPGPDLFESKRNGPLPWPKGSPVPARVVAAIERGLAPHLSERWPNMDALLDALAVEPSTTRARWRRIAVATSVMVSGAAVWGLVSTRSDLCSGGASELAEVWNDDHRARVESALISTRLTYAVDTSERVRRELDRYGDGWVQEHTEACEATSIRGEQSAAALDLRMDCLRRARMDLRAAVDVLENADATVVEKADVLVAGLPNLGWCSRIAGLEQEGPDDPSIVAQVQALREQLASANALERAGKGEAAYRRLDGLADQADAIDADALRAEVRLSEGKILTVLGRYEHAVSALRDALSSAMQIGSNRVAARAAAALSFVLGEHLHQFEWAHWMTDVGLGLARRLEDPEIEANVRSSLAVTLNSEGKYAEAEKQHRLVLALRRKVLGDVHRDIAMAHNNLGNVLHDQGKYAEAEAEHRMALDLWRQLLGTAEHPDLAMSHNNLGNDLQKQGRYADAEAQHRLALELQRKTLGEEHPRVAIAHNNFGNDLQDQGRYAEAEREHRVALQLLRKAFGAEHPVIAATHNNLGNDLHNQEKYADAEEQHRLALELQRKLLGQSHPHVATSYHNLGHALDLQKRTAEALSHYESAWAIRRDTDGPAEQKAETAFALAKLHWQLGKDADRALELAEIARDALHGAAIRDSDLAVEIDTWLGERRVETVSARAGSRTRGLQPR